MENWNALHTSNHHEVDIVAPRTTSDIAKASQVFASAFRDNPIHTYLIYKGAQAKAGTVELHEDLARREEFFNSIVSSIVESGAVLVEAGDWSAVALWEPPDYKSVQTPPPALAAAGPKVREWMEETARIKARYLTRSSPQFQAQSLLSASGTSVAELRPHYHLALTARNRDVPSVPGAVSAVVRPMLEKAHEEKVPVWLDTTNSKAVPMYEHFGFEVKETTGLGVGTDGCIEEGGEGITSFWMMRDC